MEKFSLFGPESFGFLGGLLASNLWQRTIFGLGGGAISTPKEPRPEDAASRPEGNRGTTIQNHADLQPLEKKRKEPHASY